ncbi:MAG: suppressor of fused domain protein [Candidatus Dojkabacteria bacterium]
MIKGKTAKQQLVNIYSNMYPHHEPVVHAPLRTWREGGDDPLDSIWIYKNKNGYWHYITIGFSEPYEKESPDKEMSGFGFELNLRLACTRMEEPPPLWPTKLLQTWGKYVFETGRRFSCPDYMDNGEPIDFADPDGAKSNYYGLVITHDDELQECTTHNGRVTFYALVGIIKQELTRVSGDLDGFISELRKRNPELLTEC